MKTISKRVKMTQIQKIGIVYTLRVICIQKEKVAENHMCKTVITLGNDSKEISEGCWCSYRNSNSSTFLQE